MNKWKKWEGGDCPVEHGTLVDVMHRNGSKWYKQPAGARRAQDWSHVDPNSLASLADIIKWKLSNE